MFNVRARDLDYSTGQTFWVGASDTPRCTLETLAQDIFRFHTKHAEYDPALSGAEWWTQVIDRNDDIGWHWDKDYAMEHNGINVHPHLGTVSYFSSGRGAPTLVLDCRAPMETVDSCESDASTVWVSCPVQGKHMCFDGRFLHSASAELAHEMEGDAWDTSNAQGKGKKEEEPRVTFLVNVWLNHRPEAAVPLKDKVASRLSQTRVTHDLVTHHLPCCGGNHDDHQHENNHVHHHGHTHTHAHAHERAAVESDVVKIEVERGAELVDMSWEFGESQGPPGEQKPVVHRVTVPVPVARLANLTKAADRTSATPDAMVIQYHQMNTPVPTVIRVPKKMKLGGPSRKNEP